MTPSDERNAHRSRDPSNLSAAVTPQTPHPSSEFQPRTVQSPSSRPESEILTIRLLIALAILLVGSAVTRVFSFAGEPSTIIPGSAPLVGPTRGAPLRVASRERTKPSLSHREPTPPHARPIT